jgi:adenine phosphoribosyltransferase
MQLQEYIRDVPDFPTPGIVFKDLTPLFAAPAAMAAALKDLEEAARPLAPEFVVAAESRGFILGGALALRLNAGFVPLRKPGKLPSQTVEVSYALEYGVDSLHMHADAFAGGARVLVHDDLLATGGTAAAACDLVELLGGQVVGLCFVVELGFLKGRERIGARPIESLVVF